MSKRIEMIMVITLLIVSLVSTITVLAGFGLNDVDLIIGGTRWLSFSVFLLLVRLGQYIYEDFTTTTKQVEVTLKSKEDIEKFRKEIDKELNKYIKQIAEEEKKQKKDE